jgi:hypothetical protein
VTALWFVVIWLLATLPVLGLLVAEGQRADAERGERA